MSNLIRIISENRFCDLKDAHSAAQAGENRFDREIQPMLEKAFVDPEELEKVTSGVSALTAAVQLGCYLDGMRDMIELLTFHGTMDDLYQGDNGGGAA